MSVYMCSVPWRPEIKLQVGDSWHVGAGNQTQILCKTNEYSSIIILSIRQLTGYM